MPLKRRTLIFLGVSGLVAVVGRNYLPSSDENAAAASLSQIASSINEDVRLKFAVAGDVGTGKRAQYSVAKAMAQRWQASPFPLTLLTGDNIYEEGEIEKIQTVFEEPYADLLKNGVEFYAVIGNHDFRSNEGEDQISYPGYNMPARYYTFTKQSVQFFALDTNQAQMNDSDRGKPWDAQMRWLRSELEKSSAPWKVVFAHHPVYSSGWHGSDCGLKDDLSPLFKEYGVQLYLNGHDHHYERTEPINGTTYITSGNGAKLRKVGSTYWTAYAKSRLGFATFDVYDERIIVSAIGNNNKVYDAAEIGLSS